MALLLDSFVQHIITSADAGLAGDTAAEWSTDGSQLGSGASASASSGFSVYRPSGNLNPSNVPVTRDQFLVLLRQCQRFPMRQMASPGTGKQLRRKDLEPEELFVIIDPLAYGFITMKQTRRIVSTMGLDLRASQVNKLLYYAPCLDKTRQP